MVKAKSPSELSEILTVSPNLSGLAAERHTCAQVSKTGPNTDSCGYCHYVLRADKDAI